MKRSITYILLALNIFFNACEDPYKKVDWELDSDKKRLVVEGGITNEYKTHTITLKETDDYFANRPSPRISNATVTVNDGEQTFEFTEQDTGVYVSVDSFAGVVGQPYTLNIELPYALNEETHYQAENNIIPGIPVDSVTCELYENFFGGPDTDDSTSAIFYVFGNEPAEFENYYVLRLYKNDSLLNDTIDEVGLSNDVDFGYNGDYITSWFFTENFTEEDTITFEITSVSKSYYEFVDGVQQIASGTDPFGFSGPPANPKSNIKGGGALGFFTAGFVSRGKAIPVNRRQE